MSAAASDEPAYGGDNADLLKVIAAATAFLEALRELLQPAPSDASTVSAVPTDAPRAAGSSRLQRIDIEGPE